MNGCSSHYFRFLSAVAMLLLSPVVASNDISECDLLVSVMNFEDVVGFCQRVAGQGDPGAQFNLGVMYFNGIGVAKNDAEALKWFRRAAEQGQTMAGYNLRLMYARWTGVTEAVKWSCRWPTRVWPMYRFASASHISAGMAYQWWSLAAEQGNESAQRNMKRITRLMAPEQLAAARKLSANSGNPESAAEDN